MGEVVEETDKKVKFRIKTDTMEAVIWIDRVDIDRIEKGYSCRVARVHHLAGSVSMYRCWHVQRLQQVFQVSSWRRTRTRPMR